MERARAAVAQYELTVLLTLAPVAAAELERVQSRRLQACAAVRIVLVVADEAAYYSIWVGLVPIVDLEPEYTGNSGSGSMQMQALREERRRLLHAKEKAGEHVQAHSPVVHLLVELIREHTAELVGVPLCVVDAGVAAHAASRRLCAVLSEAPTIAVVLAAQVLWPPL